MKTTVRTTIKGNESLTVKESVQHIFNALTEKTSFMVLTLISHDGKETKAGIKKTSIKMFKESK